MGDIGLVLATTTLEIETDGPLSTGELVLLFVVAAVLLVVAGVLVVLSRKGYFGDGE